MMDMTPMVYFLFMMTSNDMREDQDSYKEDANLLIFQPKDPPTSIETENAPLSPSIL